jgi:hypothetical protein
LRPGKFFVPVPLSEPIAERSDRHRLPAGDCVTVTPILGGLHHEYELQRAA